MSKSAFQIITKGAGWLLRSGSKLGEPFLCGPGYKPEIVFPKAYQNFPSVELWYMTQSMKERLNICGQVS